MICKKCKKDLKGNAEKTRSRKAARLLIKLRYSDRSIARLTGVAATTIGRWRKAATP